MTLSHPMQEFGKLAVQNGFLTHEEVTDANETLERVGELGLDITPQQFFMDKGRLDHEQVVAIEKLMGSQIELPPLSQIERFCLTDLEHVQLGQLVLRNRLLSQGQLDDALDLQNQVRSLGLNKRLGEILVERQLLDAEMIGALISIQRHFVDQTQNEATPLTIEQAEEFRDDLRFGRIAVGEGFVSEKDVNRAVRLQKSIASHTGLKFTLGGLLSDMGCMSLHHVQQCLEIQSERKQLTRDHRPVSLAPSQEARLEELIEQHELVTGEQLEEAKALMPQLADLGIQKQLGEVLILRGHLERDSLEQMLREEEERLLPLRSKLVRKLLWGVRT